MFQNIERRTVFHPRISSSFPLEDAAFPEWKVITLIVWRLVDQLLLLSVFNLKIDWLFRPDSFVHCNGKSFVWLFWFIFTRSVRSLIIPPNCYCFGRCHLTLGSFYIILLYVCTRIWSESKPPAAFEEPPQLPVNEAGSSFEDLLELQGTSTGSRFIAEKFGGNVNEFELEDWEQNRCMWLKDACYFIRFHSETSLCLGPSIWCWGASSPKRWNLTRRQA